MAASALKVQLSAFLISDSRLQGVLVILGGHVLLGHVVMAQYAVTGVTGVLEKVSLGDIRELDCLFSFFSSKKQRGFAGKITRICQLELIGFADWIRQFWPGIAAVFKGFIKMKN